MARFTSPLCALDDSLEVVGGKGRSLSRMAKAGFAVPDGFIATAHAYRKFVAESDLRGKILDLARPEVMQGRASFASAASSIQALFAVAEVPDEIAAEIAEAYASLNGDNPAVAARSSANAEDLPDLSFAGQQETFLNVRGGAALVAAVKHCWASLWTEQALSYRHQNGVDQASVAMAVVAQVMVASEVSGILFTANPATGERSEMIVNASFGLGEAVVGGHVTPDTYVVDRESLAAKETTIGPKERKIVADGAQGTRTEAVSSGERARSSLSETMLESLGATAIKIEALYDGLPQDVEWAIAKGKLWLLQSRPITNLPPQPIDVVWTPNPPAKILCRRQIVENMPDPVCPLFEELYLTEGLEHARGGKSLMVGGGPVYATLHGFAYQRADWPQLQAMQRTERLTEEELEAAERKAEEQRRKSQEIDAAMERHDLELFVDSLPPRDRAAFEDWSASAGIEDLAHALTLPESNRRSVFNKTQVNERILGKWRDITLPRLLAAIEEWRKVDPAAAEPETLLAGIRALAIAEGDYWTDDTGHTFGVAKSTDYQLQIFLQGNLPDHQFTSGQFLSGYKSRSMLANAAMYKISKRIQADESLWELVVTTPAAGLMDALRQHPESGPVREAIDEYLDVYGHQGYTLDFVEPPQREDPTPFFATLKTMVADRDYSPEKHDIEATRKREKALEDMEQLLDGLQYWQFRFRIWFTHQFYWVREESMFYLGSAWPVLRSLAAELGRRLVEVGTFRLAEDVYYCVTAELKEAIAALNANRALPEYGKRAAERRELREARKRLHPPGTIPAEASEIPGIAFKETQTRNDPTSATMLGVPVSPGTVTGPASLIKSPAEFDQMQPGSVLVCPMTNPAWTPLFAHALGLVTDIGGILGHGSIVAREYGIPAVVGTGNITQRIKSGQIISVDGDAGTVVLHADEGEKVA